MSYQVLIIDDEEPLREAIGMLGEWDQLSIDGVYEASNGAAALALLEQQHIDIALIDMKMPEMDGKELLQVLEQRYPDLLSIVVSGYDDFEYTKQAIRSRVVDYLLKPVNRQDLNHALRKAVDLLGARRIQQKQQLDQSMTLNMSLPKLKEKLYLSLMDGNDKAYLNEDLIRLSGIQQEGHLFAAVSIVMLNMEQLAEARFKGDTELLHYAVTNIVQEVSSHYFQSFSFANPKRETEIIAILSLEGSYQEGMLYKLHHQMNKLIHCLKPLLNVQLVVGTGLPVPQLQGLALSLEQARQAVASFDLKRAADSRVIAFEQQNQGPMRDTRSVLALVNKLRTMLEAGSTALVPVFLQQITELLHSAPCFTLSEADKLLEELILILNDIALGLGVPASKLPIQVNQPLRTLGVIIDYSNLQQFEASLERLALVYKQLIDQEKRGDTEFSISEIKSYIDTHYYEDIKLAQFAEKYYLSREYLIKLFKQQYGKGIHEYVQYVRMEKAKALLADSQLKIQEISEMLGYKDKNYFSKAFRNNCGMTPSEYRQSMAAT